MTSPQASEGEISTVESRIARAFWTLVVVIATVITLSIIGGEVLAPRQGVQVSFVTDAVGPSVIFWSETEEWNPEQSISIPSRAGLNQHFFPLHADSGLVARWDPGAEPGTYQILEVLLIEGDEATNLGLAALSSPESRADFQLFDGGVLSANDTDPQLLIDLGRPLDRGLSTSQLAVAAIAVLVASGIVVYLWYRTERLTQQALAVGFVAWLYVIFMLYAWKAAPRIPYWDDWRYLRELTEAGTLPMDLSWLFEATNDTIWATGKVFDGLILNSTNFSFLTLQMFGALLLGVFLVLIILLIRRVVGRIAPAVTGYAILLVGYALMAQSYWLQPAIAYHQFLPLLFGVAVLLLIDGKSHEWWRSAVVLVLALAAGFAYISGAIMLVVMGAVYLAVWWDEIRNPATRAFHLPGMVVLIVGLLSTTVQLVLVQRSQGSLLVGTSASDTVMPWNPEFFAFYLGLAGRAVGLKGAPILVLVAIAAVLTVTPFLVWMALSPRRASHHGVSRYERYVLTFAALIVPVYFALVAVGRAGLAPADGFHDVIDYGAARFHFFWGAALLALVWGGWYVSTSSASRRYRHVALIAIVVVTGLIAVPKSLSPWNYAEAFAPRTTAFLRSESCVSSHVIANDLEPVICEYASSGDIGPQLKVAYRFDMAFIEQASLPELADELGAGSP